MKYTPVESLPTDRAYLHFDAVQWTDGVQVDYELVLPLPETDCRGTFDHKGRKERPKGHKMVWLDSLNNKRIPLGRTKVGSTNPRYPFLTFDGHLDLPFRDGAHCQWDNERLGGLKLFYTINGKHYLLTREEPK